MKYSQLKISARYYAARVLCHQHLAYNGPVMSAMPAPVAGSEEAVQTNSGLCSAAHRAPCLPLTPALLRTSTREEAPSRHCRHPHSIMDLAPCSIDLRRHCHERHSPSTLLPWRSLTSWGGIDPDKSAWWAGPDSATPGTLPAQTLLLAITRRRTWDQHGHHMYLRLVGDTPLPSRTQAGRRRQWAGTSGTRQHWPQT